MIAKIGTWFITSRWGQTIILAAAMALTAFLVHWYVDSKAYNRGYAACQAEHAKAVADANIEQGKREADQRESSTEIEKATDEAVEETVADIEERTIETVEVIKYVYRDPPTPTADACTPQPLDPRVQERLDRAVDATNSARG